MAYIKVDHSLFATSVKKIDEYVADMKMKMGNANDKIDELSSTWQGNDNIQFKLQWDKVTCAGSTYAEMLKALENYSDFLQYASKEYKEAQVDAVSRANALPKW